MNRNRYFLRGTPVYDCGGCARRTRGDGESNGVGMCGQCYELGGWDNHFNDREETPTATEMEEFNSLLAAIDARGGDAERVRRDNRYIWTEEPAPTVVVQGTRVSLGDGTER